MQYSLRDINGELVQAWRQQFANCSDVTVSAGDIFAEPADAIVSPANSFGFMNGGVDLAYSRRFGWELQNRLQALLRAEHDGELPVGQAVIVETGDVTFPFLVSAPTMRVPMDVSDTVNAFLAFRAVIRTVRMHNRKGLRPIETIVCPGLGTAVGRIDPQVCAVQMHYAYRASHLGQPLAPADLMDTFRHQIDLVARRPRSS